MVSPSTIEAEAFATATVERSHTTFYWAMRMLEPEKRNAMYAIYAFCRVVDDIADEPGEVLDKRARLQFWRTEISNVYAGNPGGPVGRALAVACQRFGLDQKPFLDIIAGMEMDVGEENGRVRIADMAELELYCDRVAVAVGLLSNQIFGLDAQSGSGLAMSLGRALQLTNILRDLREDADIERLYLPLEMLKRHGIEDTELTKILASPALSALCDEIVVVAEKHFAETETILAGLPRTKVRAAIVMMQMYKRVLRRLIDRGWTNLDAPVRLSRLTRLWIAIRYGLLGA